MSTYTQLLNNLDQLKLTKMREILPNYMNDAFISDKSTTDLLKK